MSNKDSIPAETDETTGKITRREFLQYSSSVVASASFSSLTWGCGGGHSYLQRYPIDHVFTTQQRMLSFPVNMTPLGGVAPLLPQQLNQVAQYSTFGYGNWTFGSPLPVSQRLELMPLNYANPLPLRKTKFLNFFAITDIHITDKEAPNQLIHMQQIEPAAYKNTSIYSPVMLYSTQVLDAAIQTANELHKQNAFDFGISLGDVCNSTSYNELRWYLDVIDGKPIYPSSGANIGEYSVDYQAPFQAVGLDKSIPWYQVLGNHDHFFMGAFPVDANPALGFRQSYIADNVWGVGDVLKPNFATFPVLFDMAKYKTAPLYYMGQIDGASPLGGIINAGATTDAAFAFGAPMTVADPNRRSLLKTEWIQEFFNTTTAPVGHGFNLVNPANPAACYSFVPNPLMPLKVIVLDNTQSEMDGSTDIHGHGYLDSARWAWLQAELSAGQAANQLMIIAAHIPIAVASIGSELEWWAETTNIAPGMQNAVDLTTLVATLQNTTNLLMWIAGHRHLNVIKAFVSPDPAKPEMGFWQVETSSLRDFPQQFRTFEIFLNSDYSVSIQTLNVDPAVAPGTPAAVSRKYAIAAEQIVQNPLRVSNPNVATVTFGATTPAPVIVPVPTMDPTRTQVGDAVTGGGIPDPTILFEDMSGYPQPVPLNASCNAELFKQPSPVMVNVLKGLFP